jgi:hypothetical protein
MENAKLLRLRNQPLTTMSYCRLSLWGFGMPVLGWAFFAVLIAIAVPGYGQLAAFYVLFLLAIPASAVFLPILYVVSAMGFDGRTTQTVSFAVVIALTIVIAGVLFFQINRLARLDRRRDDLANALAFVIGVPVCMGAAYYRIGGMF